MALSPKILIVTGRKVWHNPLLHRILCFADFVSMEQGPEALLKACRARIAEGYSIAIFPEGKRAETDDISRFHNGAFLLSQQLEADIVPLYLHGLRNIMPSGSFICGRGDVFIRIGRRITFAEQQSLGSSTLELKKNIYRRFVDEYETVNTFASSV